MMEARLDSIEFTVTRDASQTASTKEGGNAEGLPARASARAGSRPPLQYPYSRDPSCPAWRLSLISSASAKICVAPALPKHQA